MSAINIGGDQVWQKNQFLPVGKNSVWPSGDILPITSASAILSVPSL
jgi:hypothetical protein